MYSEKANKVDKISKFLLELLSSVEKMVKKDISSYFCGLLRIYEL